MKTSFKLLGILYLMATISCNNQQSQEKGSDETDDFAFKGKIAKTYEESEEYWPKRKKPPKDRIQKINPKIHSLK